MDEGIPFVLTPADQVTADYIRWAIRKRKTPPAEFRRRCEECKRLALDATPLTEGEREQLERELQGKGNG